MPNASAASVTTIIGTIPGAATSHTTEPMPTAAAPSDSTREPRNVIGAPDTQPCNLPAAMSEPEKVTEPISRSSPTKISTDAAMVE